MGELGKLLDLLRRVRDLARRRDSARWAPNCDCEACVLLREVDQKLEDYGHG